MKKSNIINKLISELAKRVSSRIGKRSRRRKYKRKLNKNFSSLAYEMDAPELVSNVNQSRLDHLQGMQFDSQLQKINELKNNLVDINKKITDYEGMESIPVNEENKDKIFDREQEMLKLNLGKQRLENQLKMLKGGFMFGASDPLSRSVPYGRTGSIRDSLLPKIYDPKSIPTGGLNYDPLRDGVGNADISLNGRNEDNPRNIKINKIVVENPNPSINIIPPERPLTVQQTPTFTTPIPAFGRSSSPPITTTLGNERKLSEMIIEPKNYYPSKTSGYVQTDEPQLLKHWVNPPVDIRPPEYKTEGTNPNPPPIYRTEETNTNSPPAYADAQTDPYKSFPPPPPETKTVGTMFDPQAFQPKWSVMNRPMKSYITPDDPHYRSYIISMNSQAAYNHAVLDHPRYMSEEQRAKYTPGQLNEMAYYYDRHRKLNSSMF